MLKYLRLTISIKQLCSTTFAIVILSMVSGCVSYEKAMQKNEKQFIGQFPTIVTEPFGEPQYQYHDDDLFSLKPEQIQQFKKWYNNPAYAKKAGHRRLSEYLEQYTYGFDYRGDTFTASVAMENKAGNCLSLALMTTALARVVGVEVGYQKINATPVFKKNRDVLTLSHHVRTYLYDPTFEAKKGSVTIVRPRLVVDYFPNRYDVAGEAVSEARFIGMYYRNLSVDAMLEGDLNKAFWLAHKALSLSANDAENINLMAIIYRRAGFDDTSEAFYRYGMANAQNNTNLMSNYALLLDNQNRAEDARLIRQKLLDYPDNNPYSWLKLGHEAYQRNMDDMAIRYYNKAMELAPYLDEVYFGLAKSHYRERQYASAARAMKMAAEKSWEQSERELYYAKLAALRAREFE